MAKQDKKEPVQVSIRLDSEFVDRLDKIAENVSQPGLPVTRVEALRLVAFRGAAELEAETRKKTSR